MKNDTTKDVLIIVIIVMSILLLFSGFGMMGLPFGMGSYGFGGMWFFGWLFMILFPVALILLIVWLIKQIQNPGGRK